MKHLPNIFEDLNALCNAFHQTPLNGCEPDCCKNSSQGLSISEDGEYVYIDAWLPGVKSDEAEVSLDPKKRHLLIKGSGKSKREHVKYQLKSYQNFSYEVPLSHEIDLNGKIEATSKDGILSISLAKNKIEKPLKIEVKLA